MSRLQTYRQSVIQTGFDAVKTFVLQTAVEIDIFERLRAGAKTAATLAGELKAEPDSLALFLNAAVSLGLLEAEGAGYRNTKFGAEIFLQGKPLYIGDLIRLQSRQRGEWLQLKECALSGKPVSRQGFLQADEAATDGFARAMRDFAIGHAEFLSRKYLLPDARSLLDLGGGPGTFTIHFLRANPALSAVIFDLPATLKITRKLIEEAGLSSRVDYQEGDFNEDEIRGTFDVCFLSHIIHGLPAQLNERLFIKIFRALNPGGTLIIQDFFLNPDKHSPQFAALFALNMLLHTEGGRTYTFEEAEGWMKTAGFSKIKRSRLRLPHSASLLIGEKE